MASRTPGPWVIDAGFLVAPTTPGASTPPYFPLYEMDRIVGDKAADAADRAFIVGACNAHDELVAAADDALNCLIGCCVSAGGCDDRKTILDTQMRLRKILAAVGVTYAEAQ